MAKVLLAGFWLGLGALLLMSVQPMATRWCLPLLGGTPAVWAVALVFFQFTLLAGYGLAIPLAGATPRIRVAVIAPALILAWCLFPPAIDADLLAETVGEAWPVGPLLLALARGFFLPVGLVALSAPLVQAWLAQARPGLDPSPLYAASNAGSLVGLLGSPLIVEPWFDLGEQSWWWGVAHGVWGLGLLVMAVWFRPMVVPVVNQVVGDDSRSAILRAWPGWLANAAFPSMLMVALTTHLVTDVAGAPLLGILPLAVYLVSFILAFSVGAPSWLGRAQSISALVLALLWAVGSVEVRGGLALPLLLLHLTGFLMVAWGAHRRCAETRPAPGLLPWFYLALAAGGAFGGTLAALVAPYALSRSGIVEYPLALVGCCLFQPGGPRRWERGDLVRVVFMVAVSAAGGLLAWGLDLGAGGARWALVVAIPLVLAHLGSQRPGLHASLLAVAILGSQLAPDPTTRLLWQERSFFGLARVEQAADGRDTLIRLVHGGTVHGQACATWLDKEGRALALGYYHPRGPAGDLLSLPNEALGRGRVAAVGLGVGALAYYARPGEDWDFFEIDPLMERLARRREWFPYLGECRAANCRVTLGDGRMRLTDRPEGAYDLIILDAFSSDSIPAHLLTREALALYLSRLAPGGRILAHISNRHLDLEPLLQGLALDAGIGLVTWWDAGATGSDGPRGWMASHWALLGDLPKGLRGPWSGPGLAVKPVLWTDRHAALWPLVRLGGAAD